MNNVLLPGLIPALRKINRRQSIGNQCKDQLLLPRYRPAVKKIEAVIDPETLETVKLRLAELGIGGRLTLIQATGLEDLARFYQFEASGESPWKPCLRVDLVVSDRQAHPAVNIILQYAKPLDRHGTKAHVNVFSLDATLENAPEVDNTPPKGNRKPKRR